MTLIKISETAWVDLDDIIVLYHEDDELKILFCGTDKFFTIEDPLIQPFIETLMDYVRNQKHILKSKVNIDIENQKYICSRCGFNQ